jgi:hypothetical protein
MRNAPTHTNFQKCPQCPSEEEPSTHYAQNEELSLTRPSRHETTHITKSDANDAPHTITSFSLPGCIFLAHLCGHGRPKPPRFSPRDLFRISPQGMARILGANVSVKINSADTDIISPKILDPVSPPQAPFSPNAQLSPRARFSASRKVRV